jgi:hypothetical protein
MTKREEEKFQSSLRRFIIVWQISLRLFLDAFEDDFFSEDEKCSAKNHL